MARKPSQRRNFREPGMELNLTPMMNMIAILIPALWISVAFVEIASLEAQAPGSVPDHRAPATPPDLGLTVMITEAGYRIATRDASADAPEIPLVERPVDCGRYRGTRPPPRVRNTERRACGDDDGDRSFWVYDLAALREALAIVKDAHPSSRRMVIVAEPDISYEAVTDVIDAGRKRESGVLFDEVLVSPSP